MSAIDAQGRRRSGRWGLAAAGALVTYFAVVPSAAVAGAGLGIAPTMPSVVAVGDTGLPGSLTITNQNTAPETTATVDGITLIPSCAAQNPASLACVGQNPGIFDISSTAAGAVGTACGGMQFTVTPLRDAFGAVRFSPPPGTNLVLASPGTVCRIDFTVDVSNVPWDVDLTLDGEQTFQVADATQRSKGGTTGSGRGSAIVTVLKSPPPPPPPPPPAPPETPPPAPPVTPTPTPTPAPSAGSAAPQVVGSGAPGAAHINGPTGCATKNFNVTVTGKQIRRVTFSLDGKRVKTLQKPNSGRAYTLRVKPGRLKRGTHRVTARTTFTAASGTRARSLRVVFQRCERAASAPLFTG